MPGAKLNVTLARVAGASVVAVMAAAVVVDAMSAAIVVLGVGNVQKVAARLARMAVPMVEATSAVNAALKHAGMKRAVSSAVTCVATFAVNNAASKKWKARNSVKRAHHVSRVKPVSHEKAAVLSGRAVNVVIALNAANAQPSSARQPMQLSRTLQRLTGLPWQQPRAERRQMLARKHRAVSGVVSGVVAMNAVMSRVQTCAEISRKSARTLLMQHLQSYQLKILCPMHKAARPITARRANCNASRGSAEAVTVMAGSAVNVATATVLIPHHLLQVLCQMRL